MQRQVTSVRVALSDNKNHVSFFSLPFHEKCVHGIIICDASFFIVCSNVHDYENKPNISYGVVYPTEMLFYVKDFG